MEDAFRQQLVTLPPKHPTLYATASQLTACYLALGQGAKATATADDYLRNVEGKGVATSWLAPLLALRNTHPAKSGDAAGCRRTAEHCERLASTDPGELYNAACYRAVAARVARSAGDAPAAQSDDDLAVRWLTKAIAAGFNDGKQMAQNDDLAALRGRVDYRTLLATLLRETAPAPREVPR